MNDSIIQAPTKLINGSIKINGKIYAYDINEPLINMYKNTFRKHKIYIAPIWLTWNSNTAF